MPGETTSYAIWTTQLQYNNNLVVEDENQTSISGTYSLEGKYNIN